LYVTNRFFFQAEDGIRDRNVTGVQTCALPISVLLPPWVARWKTSALPMLPPWALLPLPWVLWPLSSAVLSPRTGAFAAARLQKFLLKACLRTCARATLRRLKTVHLWAVQPPTLLRLSH